MQDEAHNSLKTGIFHSFFNFPHQFGLLGRGTPSCQEKPHKQNIFKEFL